MLMQTSRRVFDLSHPRADDVCIRDIAYALSYINRFTGHAGPYSVAQHSCLVCDEVMGSTPDLALEGLLHDAHEAYVGDVSTPVKRGIGEGYSRLETDICHVVRDGLGLPFQVELPEAVKAADWLLTRMEGATFLPPHEWQGDVDKLTCGIWSPEKSEREFLDRYYRLTGLPDSRAEPQADDSSILEEAMALVHGDRGQAYGHPRDDFGRVAGAMSAMFGWEVQPHHIPQIMTIIKLSRMQMTPGKRDHWADVAGYAETGWMVVRDDPHMAEK